MNSTARGKVTATRSPQDHASRNRLGSPAKSVRSSRGSEFLAAALMLAIVGSALAVFGPFKDEARGIFALVVMLGLLFLRVPVAVALIVGGLLGIWGIRGASTVEGALRETPYSSVANWSLGVLPMFVFVGFALWRSGVAESLYIAASRWLRWLPGGLAVGTNVAGAGLSAVTGSTIATTYALGRSGIPEMLKAGYRPRLAISSVVASGLSGQLIPPSILLVIYAGIAEVPIGPQLLAGIGPGILVACLFALVFVVVAMTRRMRPGEHQAQASWRELWTSLLGSWPVVAMIVIIAGGIYSGVFTATEAGAVAALVSIVVAFMWNGRGAVRVIGEAAVKTVSTTGAIFLLLIGAHILSLMLTLSGISGSLAETLTSWNLGRVEFLMIMIVIYLILGMFLESLPSLLLTVPVLMPVIEALEISPIWFGVFAVLMGELAILTPPVGILSYIIHGMAQDPEVNQGHPIGLRDVFVAVAWILPVAILVCVLLIYFPMIATLIPDSMGMT